MRNPLAPALMAGAVLLLAAVAARAQDAHGAIAFGQAAQGGAVAYGLAWDYPSRDEAQEGAVNACLDGGGSDCTVLAEFQNGCGALAVDQYGMAQGKGARSLEQAEARALQTCEAAGGAGCAVVGSQCVSPDGQPDTWSGSESVLALPEEVSATTGGTVDRDRPAADAPRDEGLTREERMRVQQGLAALGFDAGPADGLFGPRTRSAIGEWQQAKGLEATGYLSREEAEVLAAAGAESPLNVEGAPQPTPTLTLTTPQPAATPDDVQQTIVRDRYVMGIEAARGAGDWAKVLTFVEKLRELGGELPLAVGYHQGVAYQQLGRDEEAIQALNGYLTRYLQETGERGEHYQEVQRRLLALEDRAHAEEGERYERARTAGTAAAWGQYLKDYPQGRYAAEARRSQAQAQDDEAYERARQADTPASYGSYLREYPTGRHAAEARRLQAAAERREEAERLRPGKRFRDCAECPELVVVPAGSFTMGSPASEDGRDDDEGPQHRVRIREPFAVGVYEVTFAEWDACVAGGACDGHRPNDESWGRGRRPVINVSWDDAQRYVGWLSRKTGQEYRLLSEAEWEYVARAGTTTPFHFGSTISTDQANYNGDFTYGAGRKGIDRGRTVAVGSFAANEFGLHDVHGNVWELVQDCWNTSYSGAPNDGSAWEKGECGRRVVRGGSWLIGPGGLRSALRSWDDSGFRFFNLGFRVARTLDS